jgi:hypothetical protein
VSTMESPRGDGNGGGLGLDKALDVAVIPLISAPSDFGFHRSVVFLLDLLLDLRRPLSSSPHQSSFSIRSSARVLRAGWRVDR